MLLVPVKCGSPIQDLQICCVFAKIEDDEKLSAFIVEKDFGGITLEKKKNLVLKFINQTGIF